MEPIGSAPDRGPPKQLRRPKRPCPELALHRHQQVQHVDVRAHRTHRLVDERGVVEGQRRRYRLVEGAPVFIGHYWMDGPRMPQSSKVACCDYSVPRSGRMVAYRWDGERELVAGKFVESS